ncbi:SDR family oxidoreductase [Erythrobacter sp. LQ02-29]|uniref:SDR family NAD(P)-dependent oxidoreductase n=1 Tax=Erythrobacter sp. LQ02-29 TaxID=2920384 RepID=UPI001F4E4442|nr:SDR family oxidoreductase [Erythrobacter sp. LQ02-29]MCP9221725.1 SDR family oxidoreductase [Erythrobacter sp. LQ02-29]
MPRFTNRAVLVTGGTSGIGKETARQLLAEGARVLLTGHSPDHIEQTRKDMPEATVIANDVTADGAIDELLTAIDEFAPDGLDGVFLNAGYGAFRDMAEVDGEHLDRHYQVDLRAPILQAQALGDRLKDGGKMLLIGSGTVGGGRADTMVYSAMKAGIRQAARSLATHYAKRKINVNVVTPGLTNSNFHDRGGMGEEEQKQYKEKVAGMVPLGRVGEPDDVAKAALFLLSDDANYITGTELRVDGGLTMA